VRIGCYPADTGGCGHYRLIWPAEYAARGGADVTVIEPETSAARLKAKIMEAKYDGPDSSVERGHVVGLEETPEFDVVVLQRPLSRLLVECIPHLQAAGIAVVVELDDDFERIDPRNVVYNTVHPKRSPDRNWLHLAQAVKLADVVTVSTTTLRDVCRRHRRPGASDPIVLPNYLPMHAYSAWPHSIEQDGPVHVGWSGSMASHPNDLQQTGNALARLSTLPEFGSFRVVGTGVGVPKAIGLPESLVDPTSEWHPLDEYHALLDRVDIGIVPLDDIRFNDSKSWLKGLEFAARGIPVVASPVAEYRRFAALGGCLTASRPKDWYAHLKRLTVDRGAWLDAQLSAHDAALGLALSLHADEWVDAWSMARAARLAA